MVHLFRGVRGSFQVEEVVNVANMPQVQSAGIQGQLQSPPDASTDAADAEPNASIN